MRVVISVVVLSASTAAAEPLPELIRHDELGITTVVGTADAVQGDLFLLDIHGRKTVGDHLELLARLPPVHAMTALEGDGTGGLGTAIVGARGSLTSCRWQFGMTLQGWLPTATATTSATKIDQLFAHRDPYLLSPDAVGGGFLDVAYADGSVAIQAQLGAALVFADKPEVDDVLLDLRASKQVSAALDVFAEYHLVLPPTGVMTESAAHSVGLGLTSVEDSKRWRLGLYPWFSRKDDFWLTFVLEYARY